MISNETCKNNHKELIKKRLCELYGWVAECKSPDKVCDDCAHKFYCLEWSPDMIAPAKPNPHFLEVEGESDKMAETYTFVCKSKAIWTLFQEMLEIDPHWACEDLWSTLWAGLARHSPTLEKSTDVAVRGAIDKIPRRD